jgi:hypothetical protein
VDLCTSLYCIEAHVEEVWDESLTTTGGCRRLPGVRLSASARRYRCRYAYCYSSCSRCPILVGCPAEPCSWCSHPCNCRFTKNLSHMRRRVGDGHGLWYSSGVRYLRRSQVLSPRHRHGQTLLLTPSCCGSWALKIS